MRPGIDADEINPGHMTRGIGRLTCRPGDRAPWLRGDDCWAGKGALPRADLEDGTLQGR